MSDPGTPDWLRERAERARVFAAADGEALMVPLSDALAALEARDSMKLTCVYCGAARPGEQYPYCPSCGRCHRA